MPSLINESLKIRRSVCYMINASMAWVGTTGRAETYYSKRPAKCSLRVEERCFQNLFVVVTYVWITPVHANSVAIIYHSLADFWHEQLPLAGLLVF